MRLQGLIGWCVGLSACFQEGGGGGDDAAQSGTSATTGTSGAATSDDATSQATTSAEVSTGDPDSTGHTETTDGGPICGDMNVDPGEACDDGNMLPGDGCTMCQLSGTVAWLAPFGAAGRDDSCRGVVVGTDVFAVGGLTGADGLLHGWATRLDAQGTPTWRYDHDDDLASVFNGVDLLGPERPIAVGQRNIQGPAIADGWARRFSNSGTTGTDDELIWHSTTAQAGFSAVVTVGTTLGFAASVADATNGFQAWFGELALSGFPDTSFAPTAVFGTDKGVAIGLAVGGDMPIWRGLYRSYEAASADGLTLVGFADGIDQAMASTLALPPTDAPAAITVDGEGNTIVCATDEPTQRLRIHGWSPQLVAAEPTVVDLGGIVRCTSIVALPGGGIIVGGALDGRPFAAELAEDRAQQWLAALDEYGGSVRALDVGPLATYVAVCGAIDEVGVAQTDAFVAVLAR